MKLRRLNDGEISDAAIPKNGAQDHSIRVKKIINVVISVTDHIIPKPLHIVEAYFKTKLYNNYKMLGETPTNSKNKLTKLEEKGRLILLKEHLQR
jgi:hypothetical protein